MRIISILSLCAMAALAAPAVTNANQLYAKGDQKVTTHQKQVGTLAWQEIVKSGMTPEEICAAVKRQVAYREDVGDDWKTGKDTWTDGYGDCEDFASCIADLCAESGHAASVSVIYRNGDKKGHAVVVGQWNGRMWMSSNGSYELVASEDEIKSNVAETLLESRPVETTMVSLETLKKLRGTGSGLSRRSPAEADDPAYTTSNDVGAGSGDPAYTTSNDVGAGSGDPAYTTSNFVGRVTSRGDETSLDNIVLGVPEPESAPDHPRSGGFHMVVHFRAGGSAR